MTLQPMASAFQQPPTSVVARRSTGGTVCSYLRRCVPILPGAGLVGASDVTVIGTPPQSLPPSACTCSATCREPLHVVAAFERERTGRRCGGRRFDDPLVISPYAFSVTRMPPSDRGDGRRIPTKQDRMRLVVIDGRARSPFPLRAGRRIAEPLFEGMFSV